MLVIFNDRRVVESQLICFLEPKLRVVGDAMKRSIALGHRTLAAKIPLITDEMLQKHEKGVEDSSRLYTFDIYAVAARRL